MSQRHRVRTGLDRLLQHEAWLQTLRSTRFGLLTHAPAVDRSIRLGLDALIEAGARPERLYGPEHGVRGTAQDMISVDLDVDPCTGIPSVSLYGRDEASLAPTRDQLDGIELLVIDLVDVGSRYYTYVYTAALAAREATRHGVRVLVLDRPNPLGGTVEGPTVAPPFRSFVGMLGLPNRHGLTVAEVVRWARDVEGWPIEYDALLCEGWQRSRYLDETDVPWVLPSPNMPTLDTAVVYPGQCLLEGTNLSEGRGSTRPFEIFGAPWVDAHAWRSALDDVALPGLVLRPLALEPTFQKHARTLCQGLQLHVVDRTIFQPLSTSAALLWTAARLFPSFGWRTEAYEFVEDRLAIDLLFGSDLPRRLIAERAPFRDLQHALRTPEELRAAVHSVRYGAYG
jgi:uncharacterized protein YbbC (DUF1343 family)